MNYRKSIKLFGGVRLNLSKKGVGISAGVPGLRVGIGPHGIRTTTSIPGTGIYQTKTVKLPKVKEQSKYQPIEQSQNIVQESPKQYPKGLYYANMALGWICIVGGCLMLLLTFAIGWSSFLVGLFCAIIGVVNILRGKTGLKGNK